MSVGEWGAVVTAAVAVVGVLGALLGMAIVLGADRQKLRQVVAALNNGIVERLADNTEAILELRGRLGVVVEHQRSRDQSMTELRSDVLGRLHDLHELTSRLVSGGAGKGRD